MAIKPKSTTRSKKPSVRAKTPPQPPKPAPGQAAANPAADPLYETLLTRLNAIENGLADLQPLATRMQSLSDQIEQLQATLTDQAPATAKPASPDKPRRSKAPSRAAFDNDGAPASKRDPGDAVPPGVAVKSPTPVAGDDKKILDALKAIPKRRGRRPAK